MGKHKDKDKETEEERRQRRLEKKEKKARKEAERQRQFLGYSNDANPWNDSHLTERFEWKKKTEKVAESGRASALTFMPEKERREKLQEEVKRVKEQREQRERMREQMEEDRVAIEREREQLSYVENQRKADEFHLEQAFQRAQIRLEAGRAQPIDILSFHLLLGDQERRGTAAMSQQVEDSEKRAEAAANAERAELLLSQLSEDIIKDPVNLFRGLTTAELKALLTDISEREQLDTAHDEFWSSMRVVCEAELRNQERREDERRSRADGGMGGGDEGRVGAGAPAAADAAGVSGLHPSVAHDVARSLGKKSLEQLDDMRVQIQATIDRAAGRAGLSSADADDEPVVDVDYWTGVLALLQVARAKAVLRQSQRDIVSSQAVRMRDRKASQRQLDKDGGGGTDGGGDDAELATAAEEPMALPEEPMDGRYSPTPVGVGELTAAEQRALVDADADMQALQAERRRVAATARGSIRPPAGSAGAAPTGSAGPSGVGGAGTEVVAGGGDELYNQERQRGLQPGEAQFSYEFKLDQAAAAWQERYQPRKPRYFNRILTGYEWNKYNRTHYDHDNPPPKMVQGYRFSIFYPDLVDRTVRGRGEGGACRSGKKRGGKGGMRVTRSRLRPFSESACIRAAAGPVGCNGHGYHPFQSRPTLSRRGLSYVPPASARNPALTVRVPRCGAAGIVNREWEKSARRGFKVRMDPCMSRRPTGKMASPT